MDIYDIDGVECTPKFVVKEYEMGLYCISTIGEFSCLDEALICRRSYRQVGRMSVRIEVEFRAI